MRKIKIVILCLFLLAVLVACGDTTTEVVEVKEAAETIRFNGLDARKITIITDSETGCKYIQVFEGASNGRSQSLSPLMRSDGLADCGQP